MHYQKEGEYVLALKKNHPKFYKLLTAYCQNNAITPENCLKDYFDDGHGRRVRRRYFACDIRHLEGAEKWPGVKSAIAVESIRSLDNSLQVTAEWRYYISSLSAENSCLPDTIRNHWGIENKLHWVLDVHLREDDDRKAERQSAKAFGVIKRIALNIVRTKDTKPKRSLRRKFKCAGWNNDYLMNLLI